MKNCRSTVFACYLSYITQSMFNFVSLLYVTFQNEYGISLGQISVLIAVDFGVQLLTDITSALYVKKIGYRTAVVMSNVIAGLGLIGLAVLPSVLPSPYIGLILSMVLIAFGAGLIEVMVSPIIEACPIKRKTGAMCMLHSMYCWGQVGIYLLSTLFFSTVGLENWRWLSCLLSVLPFVTAVLFLFVPIYELPADRNATASGSFIRQELFWLFAVLMTVAGASEMIMAQWASTFMETELHLDKSVGDLLGPCLFVGMEAVTRVVYSINSHRWNRKAALLLSCIVCGTGYTLAAFATINWLAIAGCVLCGAGCAILWPCTYSDASASLPNGGISMFALLAFAGDIGCLSGPSLAGQIAEWFGNNLRISFAFALLFPILGIACLLRLILKKRT